MELFIIAFVIAFGAQFIGAISGGVGLVLRPLLILIGFPASAVVSTARVASVFGTIPGLYVLNKNKKIDWKLAWFLTIPMFLGSLLAGIIVISLIEGSVEKIVGIVLLLAGVVLLLHKNAGLQERGFRFSRKKSHFIGFLGTIIISFFNTITGGMGPIFSSLYIATYGKSYISASALAKMASYLGAGVASIVFIVAGVVNWQLFVALVIGFLLGSYLGAIFGLKKGERGIRLIVLAIVFVSAIKILFF